jgi:hypothetical protein
LGEAIGGNEQLMEFGILAETVRFGVIMDGSKAPGTPAVTE